MPGFVRYCADRVSAINRRRKWKIFLDDTDITADTTVLDVGYTEEEESEVDNFMEKYYPYPRNITALGIDTPREFAKRYPEVRAVKYGGKNFPFGDKEFDICWSNAVLEHVGDEERKILFLKEIKRVSGKAFITTPNRHFPVEVHTLTFFIHWLPQRIFEKCISFFGKKWAADLKLLSYKDIKRLLEKAGIHNYKIIRNKILFLTLDFMVVFRED